MYIVVEDGYPTGLYENTQFLGLGIRPRDVTVSSNSSPIIIIDILVRNGVITVRINTITPLPQDIFLIFSKLISNENITQHI